MKLSALAIIALWLGLHGIWGDPFTAIGGAVYGFGLYLLGEAA